MVSGQLLLKLNRQSQALTAQNFLGLVFLWRNGGVLQGELKATCNNIAMNVNEEGSFNWNSSSQEVQVNYSYDLSTNNWLEKTSMPTTRRGPELAVYQNKIYAIGGYGSSSTAVYFGVNEVYDPATDTWENRTSMYAGKLGLDACVVDGRIFLIGGAYPYGPRMYTYSVDTNDVYDPANDSWTTMAPLPHDVKGYASAVLDNKIYIMGGQSGAYPVPNGTKNWVQIFDPKTNSWSEAAPLPITIKNAAAIATTGEHSPKRIYLVGGDTANEAKKIDEYGSYEILPTDANQIFNPEKGTWSMGPPIPKAQYGFSMVNVNDTIYVVGVSSSEAGHHYIQRYNPTSANSQSPGVSSNPTTTPASPIETPIPSPSIPEFQSWMILPLLALGAAAFVLLSRKER
jgi:hypothetical protein